MMLITKENLVKVRWSQIDGQLVNLYEQQVFKLDRAFVFDG